MCETIDILGTEREKMISNGLASLIRKKLGKIAEKENIHENLMKSTNPVIKDILYWTYRAANHINSKRKGDLWQRRNMTEKVELTLWIMLHHKKYRAFLEPIVSSICEKKFVQESDDKKMKFLNSALIDMALRYAYSKINHHYDGFTFHMLMDETKSGSNPACFHLQNIIHDTIKEVSMDNYEQKVLSDFVALGIWFCQHDTAYRDTFFWIMYHIGNAEVKEIVKPFYLPPKKWYINLYLLGQEEGREGRANGTLTEYQQSLLGSMSVPQARKEHLDKIIKEKLQNPK